MTLPSLAWPALAVLLSIITYLTLNRAEKNAVLRRFGLRRGPARPDTPSLEKQPTSSKPLASSTSELAATFPPSQREQLRVMRERIKRLEKENVELRKPLHHKNLTGVLQDKGLQGDHHSSKSTPRILLCTESANEARQWEGIRDKSPHGLRVRHVLSGQKVGK